MTTSELKELIEWLGFDYEETMRKYKEREKKTIRNTGIVDYVEGRLARLEKKESECWFSEKLFREFYIDIWGVICDLDGKDCEEAEDALWNAQNTLVNGYAYEDDDDLIELRHHLAKARNILKKQIHNGHKSRGNKIQGLIDTLEYLLDRYDRIIEAV